MSSSATGKDRQAAFATRAGLEALWQRFAATPISLPRRLWRKHWQMRGHDLTFVQPDKLRVLAPVGKVNDCGACTQLCCVGRNNAVLLRLRDVATLVDLGRTDLMVHQKPAFSAQELATRPALRRHARSEAWRRFPVLAQNAFGACQALGADGRCGLYPHWPLSCARFPYSLDVEAAEVFYSGRCQSYLIHPSQSPRARHMAAQAAAGYNERIKDALLLRFCADSLDDLGLLQYLRT